MRSLKAIELTSSFSRASLAFRRWRWKVCLSSRGLFTLHSPRNATHHRFPQLAYFLLLSDFVVLLPLHPPTTEKTNSSSGLIFFFSPSPQQRSFASFFCYCLSASKWIRASSQPLSICDGSLNIKVMSHIVDALCADFAVEPRRWKGRKKVVGRKAISSLMMKEINSCLIVKRA